MAKVYIGCSWFNESQSKHMEQGLQALKQNATCDFDNSYWCLDHQYKGIDVEKHPEYMDNKEWQLSTYLNDESGMENSDVGVFLYHPKYPDDGQAFEMGYMKAIHKPTILVVPNEFVQTPLNLMLVIGVTKIIKMSELSKENLDKIFRSDDTFKCF